MFKPKRLDLEAAFQTFPFENFWKLEIVKLLGKGTERDLPLPQLCPSFVQLFSCRKNSYVHMSFFQALLVWGAALRCEKKLGKAWKRHHFPSMSSTCHFFLFLLMHHVGWIGTSSQVKTSELAQIVNNASWRHHNTLAWSFNYWILPASVPCRSGM